MDDFEEACKPLIKWLNNNSNPHAIVVVEATGAELFTGERKFNTVEFVND